MLVEGSVFEDECEAVLNELEDLASQVSERSEVDNVMMGNHFTKARLSLVQLHNSAESPEERSKVAAMAKLLQQLLQTYRVQSSRPPELYEDDSDNEEWEKKGLLEEERSVQIQIDNNAFDFDVERTLLEDRHEQLQDVSKQVGLIHGIFNDIYELTHEQQLAVNELEENIESSLSAVKQGEEQLLLAQKHSRASRKTICMLSTVAALALFIVLSILFS